MVVWRRRSINQCAARLGYWEPGGRGGRGRLRRPAAAPSFPRMKLRAVRRHGAGACRMHGVCKSWHTPTPRQHALAVVPDAAECSACLSGEKACEVFGH